MSNDTMTRHVTETTHGGFTRSHDAPVACECCQHHGLSRSECGAATRIVHVPDNTCCAGWCLWAICDECFDNAGPWDAHASDPGPPMPLIGAGQEDAN